MSKVITNCSKEELLAQKQQVEALYSAFCQRNLKLDMSRGRPAAEQLNLANGALQEISNPITPSGIDTRNYGQLEGLPEMQEFFGKWLEIDPKSIIIGGNASLNLMYDAICRLMLFGTAGEQPWSKCQQVKFLCPVPGYDRHFAITERFGIEMINIPMTATGPDMDIVESLVKDDAAIKGIWCVPLYSNPQGICYSDETVDRLAKMQCAAPDFRIFWDNAYGVHHLYGKRKLKNILQACADAGNPDRAYMFFSTSKITFAGGGVSMIACGLNERKAILKEIGIQTIGYDKVNQLRTLNFLKTPENAARHMEDLAATLRPKFDIVLNTLDKELGGTGLAEWNHPDGGYFVAIDTLPGCAKETVRLASEAGVKLTPAGATFPYGKDPQDRNIRIAPSCPTPLELKQAMDLFCICVKLAGLKKLLGE